MYLGDFEVTKKVESPPGPWEQKNVHVRSTFLDIMRRFTHPSIRLLIDTPAHRVHDMVPAMKTGRDGDRGKNSLHHRFLARVTFIDNPETPCIFIPSSLDGNAAFVLFLVVVRLAP